MSFNVEKVVEFAKIFDSKLGLEKCEYIRHKGCENYVCDYR